MPILTDEQAMLQETAREALAEAAPISRFRHLRDTASPIGLDEPLWRRMAGLGWAGVMVPEDHGGLDFGLTGALLICEEAGRTLAVSPFIQTAMMAATALSAGGAVEASAWLPRIAAGEAIVTVAADEVRRHNPRQISTRAVQDAEGYRLHGGKTFVPHGAEADALLVTATAPDGPGLFLVTPGGAGLAMETTALIDSRGAADLFLDGAPARRIDGGGDGMALIDRVLDTGRIALAAEMAGMARECLDRTVAYLRDRRQFGRPIGSFQALQHRAAHLICEIEVLGAAVRSGARALEQGSPQAPGLVSLAKAKADGVATLAANEAVQMHGGIGMTDEYDIGLFMKRIRVAAHLLGDEHFHADRFARSRGF